MSKLIFAVAVVSIIAMPLSAMAQTACQQRCLVNCSGKGNMCVNNCETRCAIYGTARR